MSSEQRNFSFFSMDSKVHQSISGSRTQMALAKSTLESQESHFLQTLLSSVTTPIDATSFNQEETARTSEGKSTPLIDFSVTSNEAFLSDDKFISPFPKVQWTPPLKSFAILTDHHSDNTVEAPRETLETPLLTPSLSIFSSPYDILGTAQQKTPLSAVLDYSTSLTELEPFVPDSGILTASRHLPLYPPDTGIYFTPVPSEEVDAMWENINRSVTSLPSGATSEGSPVHLKLLGENSHAAAGATARSGDIYTRMSSRATEAVGVRTDPAPSVPWAIVAATVSAESALFSISLPFATFPGHSAAMSTYPDTVLNAGLFTQKFSSTAPNLPADSEIPSQSELDSELISPVPFTRSYSSCLYCDSVSLLPEAGFSPEHDVGSGDYVETLSFTASEVQGVTPFTTVITDKYELEEPTPEIFDTSFPSRPVVSFSSRFAEIHDSTLFLLSTVDTALDDRKPESSPSYHELPGETSLDISGFQFSLPVAGTVSLAPNTRVEDPATSTVLLETATIPSHLVASHAVSPTTWLESPELKPSESVFLFDKTSTREELSLNISDFSSNLLSTPFLIEPSYLLVSSAVLTSHSVMQSDFSTLLPQTSLTGTSLLSEDVSSWDLATAVSSATDSEVSLFSVGQISYFYSNASSVPGAPVPEIIPSSGFPSGSSVFLEASSVLPVGSEAMFTSAVSGATSQLEPSPSSLQYVAPTLVLPASDTGPLRSSVLLDETNLISVFTTFPTTPILNASSSLLSTGLASDEDIGATVKATLLLTSLSESSTHTTALLTADPDGPTQHADASSILPSPTESLSATTLFVPTQFPLTSLPPTGYDVPTGAGDADTSVAASTIPTTAATSTTGRSSVSSSPPLVTSTRPGATILPSATSTTRQPYVCDIAVPDAYLVTAGERPPTPLFCFQKPLCCEPLDKLQVLSWLLEYIREMWCKI